MKISDFSRFSAWFLAAMIGFGVAACDDEKKPDEVVVPPSKPLTVEAVISDPKVGSPGDTLLFTAVITSSSQNVGDFPDMTWTATGGIFLDTNLQSVRWVAPVAPGIYSITAKATNSAGSSSNKTDAFVGRDSTLIADFGGQINLIGGGGLDFYYLYTSEITRGTDTHQYVGGVESDPISATPRNIFAQQLNTVYAPDMSFEVHAADSLVGGVSTRPRNIYVGTFATDSYRQISVDGARPGSFDRNVHNYPSVSPNGQVVAYQRLAQSWDGVAVDSFHVYIYDLIADKRTLVTGEYEYPRAFFPTFSTDGNWLVYVMDRNRTGQWELWGSPMTGNTVDGSIAAVVKMTGTNGLITTGAPAGLRRPLMRWNPVSPILAVAASDNVLYLVQTTGTGANQIAVPEVNRASELRWSQSGGQLLASTGTDLYTVSTAGVATKR